METIDQHIYPIGVVARILDISVPTIRLYEREGLLLLKKSESGHRRLCDFDIERLKCIRKMIVEDGLNIQGIKKLMAMIPCWQLKGDCKVKDFQNCTAYNNLIGPCWSLHERPGLCQDKDCYHCPVYRRPFNCADMKSYLHETNSPVTIEK